MRELQERMGSDELSEWWAFSRILPLGDDVQRGTLAAVVASVNCWAKKPLDVADFLPRPARREQTTAEQVAIIRATVAVAGLT